MRLSQDNDYKRLTKYPLDAAFSEKSHILTYFWCVRPGKDCLTLYFSALLLCFMKTCSIMEAQHNLAALVRKVEAGSEFVVAGFIACFDGDAMTSASFTGSGVSSGASGLPLKSSAHCVFLFPMRTDGACRECDRWWLPRAFVFCE